MLHIDEKGSGDFVVLLHGAPTAPSHMLPLGDRLAKGRRVLVVHLPGYGRSAPLDPYSMERSLAAVEEGLLARGCKECHLIGFGGGAYRAVSIAVRGAVRARSLAVLAGGADYSAPERARLTQFAKIFRSGVDPASFLEEFALSPRGRETRAWVQEVRAWGFSIATDELVRELESFASAPDLRPALGKLEIPVLARVGSIDALSPPERTRRILDAAPNVVFEEVPGVGHALLCEDFLSTLTSVERHLARASTS